MLDAYAVWSFRLWWSGVKCHLLVLLLACPRCFIKSKVNTASTRRFLQQLMLLSADKLYGDANFLFQRDSHTCWQGQNHYQVAFPVMTVLDWPPTLTEVNPTENLPGIFRRTMRNSSPKAQTNQSNLGFNIISAVPQAGCLHFCIVFSLILDKKTKTKHKRHQKLKQKRAWNHSLYMSWI